VQKLNRWRVTASTYLRKDQWISVREDSCLTAEGVEVSPYYVLEYPDWVQIVALNASQQVLLVRQYRHGSGEISLELPAGRLDPEDADPVAAAKRELEEETGGCARELRHLHSGAVNPATHTNRLHTVLATGVELAAAPKNEPTENILARWVPMKEAFDAAISGVIPPLQAASLFAALAELGAVRFQPAAGE